MAKSPPAPAADERSATAEFEARLRDRMPKLTPKRRVLAQIMLADPAGLMLRTVESLGQEAAVDGATVVRLCNDLGYDGFAGLKTVLRDDYTRFRTAAEKVSRSISRGRADDTVSHVFTTDRANLELVAEWNSPAHIDALAAVIDTSRRTLVVAGGISAHISSLMAHLLRLTGVDALAPNGEVETAIQLAALGPQDLVIGISFWRYVKSTERFMAGANVAGIKTAAITDSAESGSARASQYVLRVPTDATELNNSMTAPVSLLNAIVTAVVHRNPERSLTALHGIDAILGASSII
jgi:DNA-binding MurR/RpiR family transcriptional regulator